MNKLYRIFCITSTIVTIISCLHLLSGVFGYALMLPVTFLVFFIFVDSIKNVWKTRPLTSYILLSLLWFRMVLLPFYGAVSGYYSTSGTSMELEQHFIGAVSLGVYDCMAILIVIIIFSVKGVSLKSSDVYNKLYGSSEIYVLFCLFALAIYIIVGRSMNLFDFAIKPVGVNLEREGDLTGGRELVIRQIITSAMMFLFLLVIVWLKKKDEHTISNKYFNWSIICAVLLIAIIVGERRTSQIYKAFASGYVLLSLYPTKKEKTITYITVAAIFVLASMTIYKQFYGFMYNSYAEAINNASMEDGFSYSMLDAYFYGIDTIAKNIHYGQMMEGGLSQLLYDFFRNIFGLNMLVPSDRLISSQMYNSIIYSGDQLTGYLLSSVGYGYIFIGYLLAPFATVFNVCLMLCFEGILRRTRYIEWQYLFAYLYMRIAFGVLGSTPPLINLVTRFFVINAIIIGFARLFKQKTR